MGVTWNLADIAVPGCEDCCSTFPLPSVLNALLQFLGALKGVELGPAVTE